MLPLTTPIQIPKPPFGISYADRIVLMGSCFAEHIGERLANDKFRVDNNPFGEGVAPRINNTGSVTSCRLLTLMNSAESYKSICINDFLPII